MKKALFLWGGWSGHHPQAMAELLASQLEPHGFAPTLADSLDVLADADALRQYALISPCWTMGTLTAEQRLGLLGAIKAGTGLGGIHGGMGDAFRGDLDYEWMVGGHFISHPHVGKYDVRLTDRESPVTQGIPPVFGYEGEQYYLMTEPGVSVLAETDYEFEGRTVAMPVAWTKHWGEGRVFYASYGHEPEELKRFPAALELAVRGMLWAARSL